MRMWLVLCLVGCQAIEPQPARPDWGSPPLAPPPSGPPHVVGRLEDRMVVFQFEGGQVDLELYRDGALIEQVARNRYIVPVMLQWSIATIDNAEAVTPPEGVALLPPATAPEGAGDVVVLTELQQIDPTLPYHRALSFNARLGDPHAQAVGYAYQLPYRKGLTFSVLQGFHGGFSHRGSNEYAVDFNCPVATAVLAARDGIVVAINQNAQGSGTTPEFLDDRRANFVFVLHSDGTLGEYMHLSPSGVEVKPGETVKRGQELALSGNTGFSTLPHLHFQVMTAADDGVAKHSFPFVFATAKGVLAAPLQGKRYRAWE